MKTVRFLEGCYLFSTGKFYNLNDEETLTDKEAERLQKDKIVDILKEEKKETKPKAKKKSTKKSTKKEEPKKETKKETKKDEK